METDLISNLKKARERANLTQLDLAEKLKTTQSVISAIECGKRKLSYNMLVKMANVLGDEFKPVMPQF